MTNISEALLALDEANQRRGREIEARIKTLWPDLHQDYRDLIASQKDMDGMDRLLAYLERGGHDVDVVIYQIVRYTFDAPTLDVANEQVHTGTYPDDNNVVIEDRVIIKDADTGQVVHDSNPNAMFGEED